MTTLTADMGIGGFRVGYSSLLSLSFTFHVSSPMFTSMDSHEMM
jgi:hypothetical protein